MTTINSTALDFNNIKESLKTYLKAQPEFSDYDFEASGLSTILDVLAYNTHMNGLTANMSLNESFLQSAQLRSSVVSHAESLGYFARSSTGASATLELSLNTQAVETNQITLPKYTLFTCVVDEINYTFQTLQAITAANENGRFTFRDSLGNSTIRVYEGTKKTKTFIVGEDDDDEFYVIPDLNVDTSTISIRVFESTSSNSFAVYQNVVNVPRIENDSAIYIVRETPNGYYEISFSDGRVLGQKPQPGMKIVVEYLSTKGEAANKGIIFRPVEKVLVENVYYDLDVNVLSRSAGGAPKESLQSIRKNAPFKFVAQQRLVTADDYKALIMEKYNNVLLDVISWGGQDNQPPKYGNVFVSLQFKQDIAEDVKVATKQSIVSTLSDNLAIMSINTEFADPVVCYIITETEFNFDTNLSSNSLQSQEIEVETFINDYFRDNLNIFGAIFRRSNLLTSIDNMTPAVLDSKMTTKVQRRFIPSLNLSRDYTLDFPVRLGAPNNEYHTITSVEFVYKGRPAVVKNKLGTDQLQVVATNQDVLVDNIGSYNPGRGVVSLQGLEVESVVGEYVRINALPANQATITPLRNFILSHDPELSFAQGTADNQIIVNTRL